MMYMARKRGLISRHRMDDMISDARKWIRRDVEQYVTASWWKEEDGKLKETFWTITKNAADSSVTLTRCICALGSTRTFDTRIERKSTRSPERRALESLCTRINKIMRKGWCEDKLKAEAGEGAKTVMLLHKADPENFTMPKWDEVLTQLKVDGVRAYWDSSRGKLVSRGGLEIELPHIREQLAAFSPMADLDGEIAYIGTDKTASDVVHGISQHDTDLKYYIFDRPGEGGFAYRMANDLPRFFVTMMQFLALTMLPITRHVSSLDILDQYDEVVRMGYEGLVLRNPDGKYEYDTRSHDVLKLKAEYTDDCPIIGYSSDIASGRYLVKFLITTPAGAEQWVLPRWTHDQRAIVYEWLFEKCRSKALERIGLLAKVVYRKKSPDGTFIHAVMENKYEDVVALLQKDRESFKSS